MTTETSADFARRQGVNRASVTRWAKDGRIVMAGDRVDVEASLAKLAETGGARPDVADRHAAGRVTPPAADAPFAVPSAPDGGDRIGSSFQAARAIREKYAALAAKRDYEQSLGNLIPKGDVDLALRTFGAAVRARIDVLADQVAPLVAPITDLAEVHAVLAEHLRLTLAAVADDMRRAEDAVGGAQE